jgi:predicted dehydrogenase
MFGPGTQIQLYGSQGTIKVKLAPQEAVFAARSGEMELREIDISANERGGWRVEADFIGAIRGANGVTCTDFATGLRYMEFTEAVALSAAAGAAVTLPLVAENRE